MGAVHQFVAGDALDADHAAPGAGADHRAEAEQLDRRRDDVTVGSGELVGQRDHRATPRVDRIRHRLVSAPGIPADQAAGQLLHDKLRDMPAAVAAHVHDQCVEAHLGVQVAVEVGPALTNHVRDVQVTQPAVAELAHLAAPAGHPVLVPQPPLVTQRDDHDLAWFRGGSGPPSTATTSSPGRTATPGASSGDRARGSEDSPGSTRPTSQRPAPSRVRSAPSSPIAAGPGSGRKKSTPALVM